MFQTIMNSAVEFIDNIFAFVGAGLPAFGLAGALALPFIKGDVEQARQFAASYARRERLAARGIGVQYPPEDHRTRESTQ